MKTYGELFAGIGGASQGLSYAGYKAEYAIEWNQGAIDILKANHDINTIIHGDINCVNFEGLPEVDLLWASPVCCSFSGANHHRGETVDDMMSAYAIVRAARRSKSVIIENVPEYLNSDSYRAIKELFELDGLIFNREIICNADNFGNPASRKRLYSIFSREFVRGDLPQEFPTNWADELLKYRQYWVESKLTERQENAINGDRSNPITGSVYAIERCGYYKYPTIYNRLSSYPCIKSHTHHDGKNPKLGFGKIGSYRSYMDFVHECKPYSITPQLLGVLNGFPIDYDWGSNRAQAAAGIGNAVVPRMAQIMAEMLND